MANFRVPRPPFKIFSAPSPGPQKGGYAHFSPCHKPGTEYFSGRSAPAGRE